MSGLALKKGKLSSALRKRLDEYYAKCTGVGPSYMDAKWRHWAESPDVIVYQVKNRDSLEGWIVYNTTASAVLDIVADMEQQPTHVLSNLMDVLVRAQTLVSAEVLVSDQEKYGWLVEYGFRPTRTLKTDGFSSFRMDLSIRVLAEKLKGQKPVKAYRKKEKVAIQQVPPSQCYEEIKAGLQGLLDKLGGLRKFVAPGQRVVIKPNLVADHGLMNGIYKGGVVTDVRLVRALIELLLPVAGKVIIAEGSSINRSATMKMFNLYGYDKLIDLDPKKVSIVDLNTDDAVAKAVPGGKRMLSRRVPVTLEQADVIINIPVMKLHFAAVVSLAVKSLQGTMPPLEKYMSHFFGLWQNLINIHHLVKPSLHIIDGLIAQEDFGPVSGIAKPMNLLIAGANPVAVDAVTMRIMGLEPLTSPPVWLAYMQGLGPVEPEKIETVGPPIDGLVSPFKQPEINLASGRDFVIHAGTACPGCAGYLHFAVAKLRRPDPADPSRLLIDRPFERKVNIYLGPTTEDGMNPDETNVFLGICQQHHAQDGKHLPGCPPHAEVLLNGIFSLFPDVERPKYADKTEEAKLEEMLKEVLALL